MLLNILYEDNDLLVVEKPPGMESQSVRSFEPDMVSEVKKHINTVTHKNQEPYVGVIHRLDKPVGGVMVYAKNKDSANALSKQVSEHQMEKLYCAVVCGKPVENFGTWVDYLWKDPKSNCSKIVDKGITGAKPAKLSYRLTGTLTEEGKQLSLMEIRLYSGRHHQIRVQMAGHGLPLWGDRKYNPLFQNYTGKENVALWAHSLTFFHPSAQEKMTFTAKPKGQIYCKFR